METTFKNDRRANGFTEVSSVGALVRRTESRRRHYIFSLKETYSDVRPETFKTNVSNQERPPSQVCFVIGLHSDRSSPCIFTPQQQYELSRFRKTK